MLINANKFLKNFQIKKLYFEKNKDDLLRKYVNMFVAIWWDERIAAFDEDKLVLARRVYRKIDFFPIFVFGKISDITKFAHF